MQSNSTDGIDSYRYERKFIIPPYLLNDMPQFLKHCNFKFNEIYSERIVNNIYYDTPMFKFYNENIQGVSERKKVRIRWYNDIRDEKELRLEIKLKKGLLGSKKVLKIASSPSHFFSEKLSDCNQIPPHFLLELSDVYPTLINRYKRRYFLSENALFRATIDYDIHYLPPVTNIKYLEDSFIGTRDGESILELKYNCSDDSNAHKISNEFPFRLSKKSKYISGMMNLNVL